MGKNKGYSFREGGIYNQTRNDEIANHLSEYVDAVDNLFILEGKNKKDVEEAKKVVKKACKLLKKGKPEKVFNLDRMEDILDEEDDMYDYS